MGHQQLSSICQPSCLPAPLFFDVSLLSLYLASQINVSYQEMFLRIRSFQFLVARRFSIVWHIPPFEVLCVHRSVELEIIPSASSPSDSHHSLGFSSMSHSHLPAEDPSPIHKSAWALLIGKCSECHLLCPWPWKDKAGGGVAGTHSAEDYHKWRRSSIYSECAHVYCGMSPTYMCLLLCFYGFGLQHLEIYSPEHQTVSTKGFRLKLIHFSSFSCRTLCVITGFTGGGRMENVSSVVR